jgi:hypothetical protein
MVVLASVDWWRGGIGRPPRRHEEVVKPPFEGFPWPGTHRSRSAVAYDGCACRALVLGRLEAEEGELAARRASLGPHEAMRVVGLSGGCRNGGAPSASSSSAMAAMSLLRHRESESKKKLAVKERSK